MDFDDRWSIMIDYDRWWSKWKSAAAPRLQGICSFSPWLLMAALLTVIAAILAPWRIVPGETSAVLQNSEFVFNVFKQQKNDSQNDSKMIKHPKKCFKNLLWVSGIGWGHFHDHRQDHLPNYCWNRPRGLEKRTLRLSRCFDGWKKHWKLWQKHCILHCSEWRPVDSLQMNIFWPLVLRMTDMYSLYRTHEKHDVWLLFQETIATNASTNQFSDRFGIV